MRKSLAVFLTALFFVTAPVLAASSGPSTRASTLVLSGTAILASPAAVDPGTGACNFSTWVDECSGTNCSCSSISPAKASGSGLKGASVTNFFVTADNDINPATEPTVDDGPKAKCTPFRAVVVLTFNDGGSTTANLLGVSCRHVIRTSKKTPAGIYDKDSISGGWGIATSTQPTSGWGTLSGTLSKSTNAVSLKLAGWITQ